MDDIIWSSNSLRLIASALRESSDELDTKAVLLRRCRDRGPQALRDSNGALLNDVLEQTDRAIRRLTDVSERALELARAVQFTDMLFEETEQDVRRLYEDIADLTGRPESSHPAPGMRPRRGA